MISGSDIGHSSKHNLLFEVVIRFTYQTYCKMLSVLQDERSRPDNHRGIVAFDSINWDRFKNFNRKKSFLKFTNNNTLESVKQLLRKRLISLLIRLLKHDAQ